MTVLSKPSCVLTWFESPKCLHTRIVEQVPLIATLPDNLYDKDTRLPVAPNIVQKFGASGCR